MRNLFLKGSFVLAAWVGIAHAEPLPIDGSKLEYNPTRFQLILDGEHKGEMYYELERRDGDILLHEATTLMPDIRESATAVMDGETFAPKSIVLDGDFSRTIFDTTLEVKNGVITGEYVRKQPTDIAKTPRPFSAEMPDGVIFRPAAFGLMPGLPLEEGAVFDFTWFSPLAGAMQDVKLEVTGIETVVTPAGEFETYAVYLTAPQANIVYITTSEPRRIVRIDVIGQDMRFERLPDAAE